MNSVNPHYTSLHQAREKFLHYFLITAMLPAVGYTFWDGYHQLYGGTLTDILTFIMLFISWYSIRHQGLKDWHIHFIMLGGLITFAPILVVKSLEDTGIYWMPIIPALAFMLGNIRHASLWVGLYFLSIVVCIATEQLGWLTLQYTSYEVFSMTLVTLFISGMSYFFAQHLQQVNTLFLLQNKALEEALEAAKQQSLAKSRFLSTMSHDLRTPLHGIIGIHSLLGEHNQHWTREEREYLELAQHSAHTLKSLLNDVLDLAKIESGQVPVHIQTINTASLFRETMLPFIFQAQEKDIQLQLSFHHVPQSIQTDPRLLRQILLNLMSNAIKFTEKGSIHVQVHGQEKQLYISVQDTGVGINKEEQAHIFKPFYQCNTPHTGSGTGLGTSIVKQCTELLQGSITCHSEPEQGTCFQLTLPCLQSDDVTDDFVWKLDDLMASLPTAPRVSTSTPSEIHIRVLLVEDDPITQRITHKVLSQAGMSVDVVSHGQEALDLLRNHTYDLMLTDLHMPHMDGMTLTRKVREQYGDNMLIIGLSAHAVAETIEQAKDAGMDDFLTKPVMPDDILACIQSQQGKQHST